MREILFALWFFAPAGLANATPVLAAHIPILKKLDFPLDGNLKFNGQRLFGENKTVRGLLTGVIIATITIGLQKLLVTRLGWFNGIGQYIDYGSLRSWWLGPLLGGGALIGDAVESFFKRRAGVDPGRSWFPFDQIDYIIGGLLAASLVARLSFVHYALVLFTYFGLHIVVSYCAYLLRLKERPI